jgi:hypothetical protein
VEPLLIEAGFSHRLSMENFFQAIISLCLHSVLLSRKAELDQFVRGLGPLLTIIKEHPEKAECLLLVGNTNPPTSQELLSVMKFVDVQPNIIELFKQYLATSEGM